MFDANARYLPKGKWFFSKVCYCNEDSKLYRLGVRTGDLLLCKMRDAGHRNPRIKIKLPSGKRVVLRQWDEGYENQWLVYEGCASGRGFIDLDSWKTAKTRVKNPKAFHTSGVVERALKEILDEKVK